MLLRHAESLRNRGQNQGQNQPKKQATFCPKKRPALSQANTGFASGSSTNSAQTLVKKVATTGQDVLEKGAQLKLAGGPGQF